MITRDVHQLYVVPAFVHNAKFVACGAANLGTCTCAGGVAAAGSTWFPGFTIDRLGLDRNYRSLLLAPVAFGDLNTSDENAKIKHQAIGVGLQHTSASGGTFADYSTGDWLEAQALWHQTTATSTGTYLFSQVQRDAADVLGRVAATATSTASGGALATGGPTTSTGWSWYAGPGAVFDLSGAKRFIRCLVRPVIETTACGALGFRADVAAVFGEPDVAQPDQGAIKRILVTTGCST